MVRFADMANLTVDNTANRAEARLSLAAGSNWQTVLAEAIRSPAELCRFAGLPTSVAEEAEAAAGGLPVLVPRTYLARIQPGDRNDPLLAQVLPRADEQVEVPGFQTDPLGEANALVGPGLLCKYQGRSLIVTTRACGVHCRFCFRRHFPYQMRDDGAAEWGSTVRRIAADASINEVILSGGDPLVLHDAELAELTRGLAAIPHLMRVRIHTRLPIAIPQRVTNELVGWLRETRLTPYVVVHVNHPAEIDEAVAAALGRLIDAGIPVLQQGVLLRGVNDRAEVLLALVEKLIDLRVLPYYLHQLDRVAGAAHFEVPVDIGKRLIGQLRGRLPGYAVPRYVRETANGASKELLA